MNPNLSFAEIVASLNAPSPEVVSTPAYEVIYEELLEQFRTLEPGYRYFLESDPIVKVMQAWAYERMKMNFTINVGARGTLLAFASGTFLDHIGIMWGVERAIMVIANPPAPIVMESDIRYRERISAKIRGWSNAGSRDMYRFQAMTADVRVRDVSVFSPDHLNGYNMGGQVSVCLLSYETNGVASLDLIQAVDAHLQSDSIKVLTDVVVVESAVPIVVDFNIGVRLERGASLSVFNGLSASFIEKFEARKKLGLDITHSWITDALFIAGVHSIEVIAPDVNSNVQYNEFPMLGSLSMNFLGYADQDGFNVSGVEKARAERYVYETYVAHCIETHRTQQQIIDDLVKAPRPGVIEPTVVGLANYLAIVTIRKADGSYMDEDDIALLIWNKLSTRYL